MDEIVRWLRATIEGDKTLAEAVQDPAAISLGAEFVDNCDYAVAAEHIRRHDTQNTIARCKAELALLDRYEGPDERGTTPDFWNGIREAIEMIASGYRHRAGFKPEWVSA